MTPTDPDPTAAELARLRLELEGEKKANALLYAGMGSQAELMDGLKQEARSLRAALSDRDRQLAELRVQLEQARTYCCYRCLFETKNADGVCDHCQAEAEGKELPYNQ